MIHLLHNPVGLLFAAVLAVAGAPSSDGTPAAFRGEATVELHNGRTYTGELAGVRKGRVSVLLWEGSGEIEYRLATEEIKAIDFPGTETAAYSMELYQNGRYVEAIPLLEVAYRQRSAYLDILNEKQEEPLVALARAYRSTGADIDAIAVARRLARRLASAEHRDAMETLILTAYLDLDLHERAAERARAWCSRQERYARSALGWWILAEIALLDDDPEEALWIALQPITFSTVRSMPYLENTYTTALRACYALEKNRQGTHLYSEMKERGLVWPDSALAEAADHYRTLWKEKERSSDGDITPEKLEMDSRPPRENLDLPLRDVRRILLSLPNESIEPNPEQRNPS